MTGVRNIQGEAANLSNSNDYLETSFREKGIGTWRSLYLKILAHPFFNDYQSILELGAGTPDFLKNCKINHRVAVDIGDKYQDSFEKNHIEFHRANLENDDLSSLGFFDVVICSDVFEHLLYPLDVLKKIKQLMNTKAVLFSHVPNEFVLAKTMSIMFLGSENLYFHKDDEEWNDSHVRRFTFTGYEKFLRQCFQYNVYINPVYDKGILKFLRRCRINIPFCLEKGPTFISTNDEQVANTIFQLIESRKIT